MVDAASCGVCNTWWPCNQPDGIKSMQLHCHDELHTRQDAASTIMERIPRVPAMSKVQRIYLHTMIGGLGGWLGWMLYGEWCDPAWSWHTLALLAGLLIGSCIGLGLAAVEARSS